MLYYEAFAAHTVQEIFKVVFLVNLCIYITLQRRRYFPFPCISSEEGSC